MIQNKSTYRQISLAFLMLFMSFIIAPTAMVTFIDADVDVSTVFALVEEETKESKEKSVLDSDEEFQKSLISPLEFKVKEIQTPQTFFKMQLSNLYCPGEIAPPPELS